MLAELSSCETWLYEDEESEDADQARYGEELLKIQTLCDTRPPRHAPPPGQTLPSPRRWGGAAALSHSARARARWACGGLPPDVRARVVHTRTEGCAHAHCAHAHGSGA